MENLWAFSRNRFLVQVKTLSSAGDVHQLRTLVRQEFQRKSSSSMCFAERRWSSPWWAMFSHSAWGWSWWNTGVERLQQRFKSRSLWLVQEESEHAMTKSPGCANRLMICCLFMHPVSFCVGVSQHMYTYRISQTWKIWDQLPPKSFVFRKISRLKTGKCGEGLWQPARKDMNHHERSCRTSVAWKHHFGDVVESCCDADKPDPLRRWKCDLQQIDR